MEGVAQGFLLVEPFAEIARRPTTRYHREAIFGQPLANSGANTTHTAGDVRYSCCHVVLLDFLHFLKLSCY